MAWESPEIAHASHSPYIFISTAMLRQFLNRFITTRRLKLAFISGSGMGVSPEICHALRSPSIFILMAMFQTDLLQQVASSFPEGCAKLKRRFFAGAHCLSLLHFSLLCGANSGPTTGQAILV